MSQQNNRTLSLDSFARFFLPWIYSVEKSRVQTLYLSFPASVACSTVAAYSDQHLISVYVGLELKHSVAVDLLLHVDVGMSVSFISLCANSFKVFTVALRMNIN